MEPWAGALAYALGEDGHEAPEVSEVSGHPALAPVVEALGGIDRVVASAEAAELAGRPWPRPVARPDELGWAQWAALLAAARQQVGQARAERSGRVLVGRAPDADEVRLLRDVPPHHGA